MDHAELWEPIETAPRTRTLRCGWFAGSPDRYPLDLEKHLVWFRGGWRDPNNRFSDHEWFPTHYHAKQ